MGESTATTAVSTRVKPVQVDVIDHLARREGLTRSSYIARAVEQALTAARKKAAA